ncbi:MAG TPA: polyprenyl diphosphate synthase [Armatimonadota bacterium]|jgi:undecaprenyl diphosphate synthase
MDTDFSDLTLPDHIAIIMDGNGRWADHRGLPRLQGHFEGRMATRRIVQACNDIGLKYLSVYAFSVENWRRPVDEVEGLLSLIEMALAEELTELCRNDVRLMHSGRLGELPESLQRIVREAREETRDNQGMVLNLLVNYGGRAEIVDAARAFATQVAAGEARPEDLNEESFRQGLYLPDLPDPDLLIRSGGEQRISNFLLWEVAYSELVVTDVLWPDFTEQHLADAVREYNRRQRRFGGVPEAQSNQRSDLSMP